VPDADESSWISTAATSARTIGVRVIVPLRAVERYLIRRPVSRHHCHRCITQAAVRRSVYSSTCRGFQAVRARFRAVPGDVLTPGCRSIVTARGGRNRSPSRSKASRSSPMDARVHVPARSAPIAGGYEGCPMQRVGGGTRAPALTED
jgi:hypothetical protein